MADPIVEDTMEYLEQDDFIEPKEPPKPNWWTVAIYEVCLCWGGPEEGGWWYDYGTIVNDCPPMHFFTREEAVESMHQVQVFIDMFINSHRRSYRSSVPDDQRRAVIFQGHAPEFFPEVRPHYE